MESQRKESLLSLDTKVQIGKKVIEESFTNFSRPTVVWSGGKDSTVVLDLVRKVSHELDLKIPPCIFIDHGDHYEETFEILEKVSNEWGFKIIYAKNDNVLQNIKDGLIEVNSLSLENKREIEKIGFQGSEFEYSLETEVGNHLLKTVAMNGTIRKYGFDALFTGVRWDENPARASEVFMSKRNNPEHVRIHPILTFLERDIWTYIFANNLPIHPKYKEGYRSIDGIHDSKKTSDIPAWEQDMESTGERAGRSQDKEGMMERLRRNGYM